MQENEVGISAFARFAFISVYSFFVVYAIKSFTIVSFSSYRLVYALHFRFLSIESSQCDFAHRFDILNAVDDVVHFWHKLIKQIAIA